MHEVRRGWRVLAIGLLASVLPLQASAIGIEDIVDGGNDYAWQRVEIPGTLCGNGSQYKFWYYDSPTSTNLLVMFEGGGACWDYETCSGQAGLSSPTAGSWSTCRTAPATSTSATTW